MPEASSMAMNGSRENSLLARQTEAIRQMLTLNQVSSGGMNNGSAPMWKVLVYDSIGQSILAPIFSVKELRELGVTLHIALHSERDAVPDVPAVYFCLPSEENLERINRDLESSLYGRFFFNFISPIPRQKLEDLATFALQNNVVAQIEKVYDQFVHFICLEHSMFTLRHQTNYSAPNNLSFYSLNKAEMTDTEMDAITDDIVNGLFAVCVTLGTIPVIRCPKNGAAEYVSKKLDKKLRENLRDTRNSLFLNEGGMQGGGQFSFHRPLLVILDRQVDLATPLHHTWTYQALAHDVLQYSLNRVSITEGDQGAGARRKTRVCDLDSKDQFWMNHKGSPFPLVAEKIEEELEDYRSKEEDIKRMKSDMGLESGNENDAAIGLLSDNTQKLTSAVSSLPLLLEKKRLIDMHTSLATAILDQIKLRKLDLFFELEEKILSKQNLDKSLKEVFDDRDAGTPDDKMRLFLIFYICSHQLPDSEVDDYANILQEIGCDLAPLQYLKRWKSLSQMTTLPTTDYAGSSGGATTLKTLSTLGTVFMQGVKNLVVKKHNLPITKIVDELMEIKQGQYNDDYCYFDPKILRGQDNIPRAKNPFQEAIVFVVGGGNYIEYQNLMDHANSKASLMASGLSSSNLAGMSSSTSSLSSSTASSKRIVYGCTTLHNSNQMMQQLSKLGHEM